uniref:Uncharacterized protein n=1 Tax=Pyxicephalus adspersus TaxID=30357 RepID=A0AAV2ZH07_PYXAD|nr:TPA: hypothetical protein GDO54_003792 [Pyxicephalus adspersus]
MVLTFVRSQKEAFKVLIFNMEGIYMIPTPQKLGILQLWPQKEEHLGISGGSADKVVKKWALHRPCHFALNGNPSNPIVYWITYKPMC